MCTVQSSVGGDSSFFASVATQQESPYVSLGPAYTAEGSRSQGMDQEKKDIDLNCFNLKRSLSMFTVSSPSPASPSPNSSVGTPNPTPTPPTEPLTKHRKLINDKYSNSDASNEKQGNTKNRGSDNDKDNTICPVNYDIIMNSIELLSSGGPLLLIPIEPPPSPLSILLSLSINNPNIISSTLRNNPSNNRNDNYNKYGHLNLKNPNQKLYYSREDDERHAYSLSVNTNLTTKNHQKDHDQEKKYSNRKNILSFNTYNNNNNNKNGINPIDFGAATIYDSSFKDIDISENADRSFLSLKSRYHILSRKR